MRRGWIPLLLALCALLGACGRPQPSVLLISVDSLRFDQLDRREGDREVTPRLNTWMRQTVSFRRAISPAPWTTPSMMSIFTGMPAPLHAVEDHDRALASSVETLTERFKRAGYRTAAFVPASTLRGEYGFARGFDLYDFENIGHIRLSSALFASKVLAQIEQSRDEPFFIWAHIWDPHYNYTPPVPWDSAFARGTPPPSDDVQCLKWVENAVRPAEAEWLYGRYQGESAYTDKELGALLAGAKQLMADRPLIVVLFADHGESFQEHGWLGHTNRLDETLIHVPLMIQAPELTPSMRDELVSTASIGRTLLELAGVQDAKSFGVEPSLLDQQTPPGREAVLSQTVRQGCYTALREAHFKLIIDQRTCGAELFDLDRDPGETNNLAATQPDQVHALRNRLKVELAALSARSVPRGALPPELVETLEQQLRTLGYVGGVGPDGQAQVSCTLAPRTAMRDLLGDTTAEPCPLEGVARCLP
jgi:arylsulfatase A-like enzyme